MHLGPRDKVRASPTGMMSHVVNAFEQSNKLGQMGCCLLVVPLYLFKSLFKTSVHFCKLVLHMFAALPEGLDTCNHWNG